MNTVRKNNSAILIKKTLTVILVGVFLFINTISWAKEGRLSSTEIENIFFSSHTADKDKLAPPSGSKAQELKARFLAGEAILSHKRNNEYIRKTLTGIGYEKLLRELKHIDGVDVEVELIAIPGLLKFTGLPAHVGLGRYYGKPVIYIDQDLFYNEDIRQHEFDEVSRWEALRSLLKRKPDKMREWIMQNIDTPVTDEELKNTKYYCKTSRQIAEIIHSEAHQLPKELLRQRADMVDYEWIDLMFSLYGTDENDGDVTIAAAKIGIETIFAKIYKNVFENERYISVAAMIDRLDICEEDTVLCVELGNFSQFPAACAANGATVDVYKPLSHNRFSEASQTGKLGDFVKDAKERMAKIYGKDFIGDRVNTKVFYGWGTEANLPPEKYSCVFLLNILNVVFDWDDKEDLFTEVLSSLKDDAIIIMPSFGTHMSDFDHDRNIFFKYAEKMGYSFAFKRYYSEGYKTFGGCEVYGVCRSAESHSPTPSIAKTDKTKTSEKSAVKVMRSFDVSPEQSSDYDLFRREVSYSVGGLDRMLDEEAVDILYEMGGNIYRHSKGRSGSLKVQALTMGANKGTRFIASNKTDSFGLCDFFVTFANVMDAFNDADTFHVGLVKMMKFADDFSLSYNGNTLTISVTRWQRPMTKKHLSITVPNIDEKEMVGKIKSIPDHNYERLELLCLDEGNVGKVARGIKKRIYKESVEEDSSSGASSPRGHINDKGSPAACLNTIKNDADLLKRALNPTDGIKVNEVAKLRSYHPSTVYKEFKILKDLGIFIPVEGRRGYYRFSDMMIGPNENYVKTLVNAINDIQYQIGKRGEERPLHRWSPADEKIGLVKELIKMTILHQINIMQKPTVPEGKVLWHLLEQDVVSSSQRSSFAQEVNNAAEKSKASERIYILRKDESIEDSIARIIKYHPEAMFDAALSDESHIENVPGNIKRLVFKGSAGDVAQLEGIIAALRALHGPREDIVPILERIYAVLKGVDCQYKLAPDVIDDPIKFAHSFIFDLPPATSIPADEISEVKERMLQLLIAA